MSEYEEVDSIFDNPPEKIDPSLLEEPSKLVKASPHLTELWRYGYPVQRLEHLAQCALLLKESYSPLAWHVQRAEIDPDYWNKFSAARPNWLSPERLSQELSERQCFSTAETGVDNAG
jgi:hypothetical protein